MALPTEARGDGSKTHPPPAEIGRPGKAILADRAFKRTTGGNEPHQTRNSIFGQRTETELRFSIGKRVAGVCRGGPPWPPVRLDRVAMAGHPYQTLCLTGFDAADSINACCGACDAELADGWLTPLGNTDGRIANRHMAGTAKPRSRSVNKPALSNVRQTRSAVSFAEPCSRRGHGSYPTVSSVVCAISERACANVAIRNDGLSTRRARA